MIPLVSKIAIAAELPVTEIPEQVFVEMGLTVFIGNGVMTNC